MLLSLKTINKKKQPSSIVSSKKKWWTKVGVELCVPRDKLGCKFTTRKSCGGVEWQVEHGLLQNL
jgi:hypothetical protein